MSADKTIVILGNEKVGKSQLIKLYLGRSGGSEVYDSTIEDDFEKAEKVGGRQIPIRYLDTGGNPEFREQMVEQWVASGDAFMLVFSVEEPKSMEAVKEIHSVISKTFAQPSSLPLPPRLLVANSLTGDSMARKVSEDAARELAMELEVPLVETCSALNGINVEYAFGRLLGDIYGEDAISLAIRSPLPTTRVLNTPAKKTEEKVESSEGKVAQLLPKKLVFSPAPRLVNNCRQATIVLLGATQVGKSMMLRHYMEKPMGQEISYDSTIEDEVEKSEKVFDQDYAVKVLDTGGILDTQLNQEWVQRGDALVLIFDIDNPASIQHLHSLISAIAASRDQSRRRTVVLVGNHAKYGSDCSSHAQHAEVQKLLSLLHGESPIYLECSSSTGQHVMETFHKILQHMHNVMNGNEVKSLTSCVPTVAAAKPEKAQARQSNPKTELVKQEEKKHSFPRRKSKDTIPALSSRPATPRRNSQPEIRRVNSKVTHRRASQPELAAAHVTPVPRASASAPESRRASKPDVTPPPVPKRPSVSQQMPKLERKVSVPKLERRSSQTELPKLERKHVHAAPKLERQAAHRQLSGMKEKGEMATPPRIPPRPSFSTCKKLNDTPILESALAGGLTEAKVVVAGASQTGKSALLSWHFERKSDPSNYDATVEDRYQKVESCKGQPINATYIDTGGSDECQDLIPEWIKEGDAYIFVFNTEDPKSLKRVRELHSMIQDETKPRVVVANSPSRDLQKRKVTRQQGANLAAELRAPYVETCTENGSNISAVFALLMSSIMEQKKSPVTPPPLPPRKKLSISTAKKCTPPVPPRPSRMGKA